MVLSPSKTQKSTLKRHRTVSHTHARWNCFHGSTLRVRPGGKTRPRAENNPPSTTYGFAFARTSVPGREANFCKRTIQKRYHVMALHLSGRLTSEKFLKSYSYTDPCRNGLDLSSGFIEKCLADTPLSAGTNIHGDLIFHFCMGAFPECVQQGRAGESEGGQT